MNAQVTVGPRRLLVVSAGLRTPSSSRLLADRLAESALEALAARGLAGEADSVELREHARDLTSMLLTGAPTAALDGLFEQVRTTDAMILVTPIYSGSYTGMVKDLIDLLPDDAIDGVPVLMGGTGGTVRHALALDHTLRPLLGHVHAIAAATAVFAATEDFGAAQRGEPAPGGPLVQRIGRAGADLADLVAGRPPRRATDPFDVSGFAELLGDS